MPTVEHGKVKPEKLAATAVGLLDREVKIPNTFTKHSVEEFKGARDDTINMKVPGLLPWREYGWRNDRSTELEMDSYTERKIALSFGGDAYSGVYLTDEQKDFDLIQWSELLEMQARAVGRGLENGAVKTLRDGDYEVVLGLQDAPKDGALRYALIEARRVLNRFNVPGNRILLVGTDVEAQMLNDPTLTLANYVGDGNANQALREATIGRVAGFTVVTSNEIGTHEAYAYVPGAFAFLNAAPSVPDSVPFGANASYNGISLRWIRDYESRRTQDRSIVNTYYGFRQVTDVLRGINEETGVEVISTGEYFVRGVKLEIGATSQYPTGELATITGLTPPRGPLTEAFGVNGEEPAV